MIEDVAVRDVMTREFLGVSESDSVVDVVGHMLADDRSDVVVLRGSEPVGMITSHDVLSLVGANGIPPEEPVSAIMEPPAPTVAADYDLASAALRMSGQNLDTLLVVDDGELVGLLTERDVLAAAASLLNDDLDATTDAPLMEDVEAIEDENFEDQYSNQSLCEICGSLTPSLQNINGQLVCADCRDV